MHVTDYKKFIKNAKEQYKKIGSINCPAFQGEKIYFTNKGFNHLIRKGHELRTRNQQIRRIRLLKHAGKILLETATFTTHRVVEKINSVAYFWSVENIIGGKSIVVIICQIDQEPKKFLSIINKKVTRKHKTPEGVL